MNKKEELISAIKELPEVKRLKELENYIDNNHKIKILLDGLLLKQKELVNARELNLINTYKKCLDEYEILKQEFLNLPFTEEYLDLLNECHLVIKKIIEIIETQIENDFKNQ